MEVELAENQEYRIEIAENKSCRMMVTAGVAEIKGQELLSEKWYVFTNTKIAICTFTGAKLKIEGNPDLQYTARQSMMPQVAKYFDYLFRTDGLERSILVLGKGRTTFCTTLANYVVRVHKTCVLSVIDPSNKVIFPGAIGWLTIDTISDYVDGIKLNNPSCYFYGNTEIQNADLYDIQIDNMIKEQESLTGQLNMIIAPHMSQDEVNRMIKRFKIKEVIFIGDERLYNSMRLIVDSIFVDNSAYIQENSVMWCINRYFNGPTGEYSPCSFIAKAGKGVVRIGEEHAAPESALPLGAVRKVENTSVNSVEPIEGHVLAISEVDKEEEIATSKVSGFVVCQNSETFRVLCAQPKLPKNCYLVQGNVKYSDY